jgi:acyl-coenzyme A thioesterase PaaI-like protein
MTDEVPAHHPNCFGCGAENPSSMGLRMRIDEGHVLGTIRFAPHHEGGPGLAHGGAVAAVFDDLLGAVPSALHLPAVTASLTVQFRAPAILGSEVRLEAHLERRDGRKLTIHGTMHHDATLLAEASALFLVVDLDHFRQAGQPLPDAWTHWHDSPEPRSDTPRPV